MSGIELLFLDGGATVGAAASAVAGWIGLRERNRDAAELASDPAELKRLLEELQQAHAAASAGHRALSSTWRSPLSLFDARDEASAIARGVAPWAVNCAHRARRLVDEASALCNRADEYETQLTIAMEAAGRGLQRDPVKNLIQCLVDLAPKLTVHVRFLKAARAEFDAASGQVVEGMTPKEYLTFEEKSMLLRSLSTTLPESVLRHKGRVGEFFNQSAVALQTIVHRAAAVAGAAGPAASSEDPAQEVRRLPIHGAPVVDSDMLLRQLRSDDWVERRIAAESLGQLRDKAAVRPLCDTMRSDAVDFVREVSAIALGLIGDAAAVAELSRALLDPYLRAAAAASLQQIGDAGTAPLIFAAQQNDEEELKRLLG